MKIREVNNLLLFLCSIMVMLLSAGCNKDSDTSELNGTQWIAGYSDYVSGLGDIDIAYVLNFTKVKANLTTSVWGTRLSVVYTYSHTDTLVLFSDAEIVINDDNLEFWKFVTEESEMTLQEIKELVSQALVTATLNGDTLTFPNRRLDGGDLVFERAK